MPLPVSFVVKKVDSREVGGRQVARLELESTDGISQLIDPGALLASPGLYIGLVVAAALFAGAVWVRRFREES